LFLPVNVKVEVLGRGREDGHRFRAEHQPRRTAKDHAGMGLPIVPWRAHGRIVEPSLPVADFATGGHFFVIKRPSSDRPNVSEWIMIGFRNYYEDAINPLS
jgi:hypothetical protein